MKAPKIIKISLASSITELENERKDISSTITEEISNLFQRDDIIIQFKRCDTIHEGNTGEPDQDKLDRLIRECDICLFLFKDKVGPITRHEFDVARECQKKEKNKPKIFVSFLEVPQKLNSEEVIENGKSLLEFKKQLEKLGIHWNEYDNLSDVKHKWVLGILTHLGITLGDSSPAEKSGDGLFEQFEKHKEQMHQAIDDLRAQIPCIMDDDKHLITARIAQTIDLYKKADLWASKTDYDKAKYSDLLFDYAKFLDKYGLYYHDALAVIQRVTMESADFYKCLGSIMFHLDRYEEAEDAYDKAISLNPGSVEARLGKAEVYLRIGKDKDAIKSAQKILERKDSSEQDRILANNIVSQSEGDYKKSIDCSTRAIELLNKDISDEGRNKEETEKKQYLLAKAYRERGDGFRFTNEHKQSLEDYQNALEIFRKVRGENCEETALSLGCVGVAYLNLGEYENAINYTKDALSIREKIFGEENTHTAESYYWLGVIHSRESRENKYYKPYTALEYYSKALAINEKALGKEHLKVSISYNNIGLVYWNQGDYPKALEYFVKALTIFKGVLGTEQSNTATVYNNIGLAYKEQGDFSKALENYVKALAIHEEALSTDPLDTATDYNCIGEVYDAQGDYPKALENYLKALAIREKVQGSEHPDTATTYNNIGLVYWNQGDYPNALEYYSKALTIWEKVLGTEHPDTAASYFCIGAASHAQGDYTNALEYYSKALAIREKVLGTEHPDIAASYFCIGAVYHAQGEYTYALENYSKALAIREKVLGTEHPDTAASYFSIGAVYHAQGDYTNALEYYSKALAIREKVLGTEHLDTAYSYNNIGSVYYNIHQYPDAMENLEKAFKIFKNRLGEDHPGTKNTQEWIDATKAAMEKE